MFEDKTFESIMTAMLDRVPDRLDKREGSIIYDAIAPMAAELAQAYIQMDYLINQSFADTADREYLARRASERNLYPEPATKAVMRGIFTPADLEIPIGYRYSLEDYNYVVIQKDAAGEYRLQCETEGSAPNNIFGSLIPIDNLSGLTDAQITECLILGEDEEPTEVFRARYFETFSNQASGGNIAWYKQTTHAIPGVGGVRVYRAWNGAGTVKLTITDAEFHVPTQELVNVVQTTLDPTQNHGDGVGLAPIGHVVTVVPAASTAINVTATFTFESGVSFDDIKEAAKAALDNYIGGLNAAWEDEGTIVVRIAQVESRLVSLAGVVDITNVRINGAASNYTLPADTLAERGTINGTS